MRNKEIAFARDDSAVLRWKLQGSKQVNANDNTFVGSRALRAA